MREWIELIELANPPEIKDFKKSFDSDMINSRVQSQAARRNPKWVTSLNKFMKKYDFTPVGNGINGVVFQNPNYPFVIKVYRRDLGYDEWLYFVRTHQNNKYVPKIKGSVIRLNKIFNAVRLEPLEYCNLTKANDFIKQLEDAIWTHGKIDETNVDLSEIAEFLNDWEGHTDLSSYNVMCRPDGQIVLIDPLYYNSELDE